MRKKRKKKTKDKRAKLIRLISKRIRYELKKRRKQKGGHSWKTKKGNWAPNLLAMCKPKEKKKGKGR